VKLIIIIIDLDQLIVNKKKSSCAAAVEQELRYHQALFDRLGGLVGGIVE
jgi:hypothetical protein